MAAFNPDPFIATLEGAVQALIPLRRQVAQQIKTSERDVLQKEKQYRAKVDDFKKGLEVRAHHIVFDSWHV